MIENGESPEGPQNDVPSGSSGSVTTTGTHTTKGNGPITRVPVEILSEIFYIVRAHSQRDDFWVRILRVCTHWQEVAFGTARLWTRISDHESPAFLNRTLSCSGRLPLEVTMIFRASNTSSFAQTLLPHSHRVKTLATVLSHPEDIVLLGTVSLPEVRTVLFSCNTLQYPFPFAQFSTVAVAHLTNADIGFTTVNLANLTWLVIDNSIHYLPSLVDVISVLRNAPALVQVGLMGCAGFTREDLTALRSTQVIQMQKLRTLYISSEAIYIREFFNVVSVSALAQIALHVRMPLAWQRVGGTNICSISLPTAEKFHHVGCLLSANIIAVELRGDKPGLSCVDKTTGGALQWTYTATDTYTAASPYFWQDLIEDFAEAIGHLSMDRIANFSLSLRDDPFAEEELHFVPLFRALPNMHMLLVQAQRAEGVLGALTYLQDTACELGVAVCPRLSVLRLQDLVVDDSVVEKLLDCFLMRKDTCDEGLDYLLLAIGSVRLDTKHLARLEEEEFRTIVCEAE